MKYSFLVFFIFLILQINQIRHQKPPDYFRKTTPSYFVFYFSFIL